MDVFLRNVGIVPRRSLAQEACRRGLIEIDSKPAKPSAQVRSGQKLTVRLGMKTREYIVLEVPPRPVPRARRRECIQLVHEEEVGFSE
ncbi:MAG: RNA-binding S4 domain-containing protein [Armatimonadetes bacterium]|nr:RNA-binding S4 domain-containing protein [Armatimonadota bacterium]